MSQVSRCRQCGCTDDDCSGCIERTGRACYWVAADRCSACLPPMQQVVDSPAIKRLIEEVRAEKTSGVRAYNRVYSRHNRS